MPATLNSEELHYPVQIAPNLAAGVQVDGWWFTVEYADRSGREGRIRYRWTIFKGRREYTGDDLQSGCGGGTLTQGLESFLSFLSACGEAFLHQERTGRECENIDLFPRRVAKLAAKYHDELSMLACEIEDGR